MLSDIAKERAIVGLVVDGQFWRVADNEWLIPPEAFYDDLCRVVYSGARFLVREKGMDATPDRINEWLEKNGRYKELEKIRHGHDWKAWHKDPDIDHSLSAAPEPFGLIKYALEDIERYYANRQERDIRKLLSEDNITLPDAIERLASIARIQHGKNGDSHNDKLTIWTPSQFLAYEDDPQDVLLSCGYLEKGSPLAVCGPPGIGKSRLIVQLAIQSILGNTFLDWDTNAERLKWLVLQNENGNRRMKGEYTAMLGIFTSAQRKMLDDALYMTAIVSDIDGDLNLADEHVRRRITEAIGDLKPDIVVGDPLTALTVEDLNNDMAMLNTARQFGRIAKINNKKASPVLIQHARTGKEAQAGMSGANRASYARNSKALHGWVRAQWNLGAVESKKNDRLFFASGKCNNFAEFDEFVIELDASTRFYSRTNEDPDSIRKESDEREDGKSPHSGRPPKLTRSHLKGYMSAIVPLLKEQIKQDLCRKHNVSAKTFTRVWDDAAELSLVKEDRDDKWLWVG